MILKVNINHRPCFILSPAWPDAVVTASPPSRPAGLQIKSFKGELDLRALNSFYGVVEVCLDRVVLRMVGTDDDTSLCARTPPSLGAEPEHGDLYDGQYRLLSPLYPRSAPENRSSERPSGDLEPVPVPAASNNTTTGEITFMVRLRLGPLLQSAVQCIYDIRADPGERLRLTAHSPCVGWLLDGQVRYLYLYLVSDFHLVFYSL